MKNSGFRLAAKLSLPLEIELKLLLAFRRQSHWQNR